MLFNYIIIASIILFSSLHTFAKETPLGFVQCISTTNEAFYKISMFNNDDLSYLQYSETQQPIVLKITNTVEWSKKNYLPRSYFAEGSGDDSFHLLLHSSNIKIDVHDSKKVYRGKAKILNLNGKLLQKPLAMNCLIAFLAE